MLVDSLPPPLKKVLVTVVRWGSSGLRWANILFAIPSSLLCLTAHYRILWKAQVIVVMLHPSGFGHTITGPDITRRLFSDRRSVFIVLSNNVIHNWKVAAIWPDIDVIFVRFKLNLNIPYAWKKRKMKEGNIAIERSIRIEQQIIHWEKIPDDNIFKRLVLDELYYLKDGKV